MVSADLPDFEEPLPLFATSDPPFHHMGEHRHCSPKLVSLST